MQNYDEVLVSLERTLSWNPTLIINYDEVLVSLRLTLVRNLTTIQQKQQRPSGIVISLASFLSLSFLLQLLTCHGHGSPSLSS